MRAATVPAFLLVLSAAGAAAPLAAQRRELTLLAGGNFSGASGGGIDKSQARAGFQAGLSLRMPRSPMLSFQTEVLVVQRRLFAERAPSTLPSQQVGPRSDAPNLIFAQIPLLLRIQRGYSTRRPVRPFLLLGPYIGVRLACKRELVEASGGVSHPDCTVTPPGFQPTADPYFPALYQDLDVGFLGELGVEARRIALGLRFEKSLRNLVEPGGFTTSPLERARIWSASLSAEYMLRVI
jgi:hypothetical protein